MKTYSKISIFLLIAIALFTSCRKDEDDTIKQVNKEIYKTMQVYYLWYQYLPTSSTVNPGDYNNPQEFIEAIRYPLYDKWSYVQTMEDYNQFSGGKMVGHGFSFGQDENENIRILYVYRNTQTAESGVKRGWIISKVNGTFVNSGNISDLIGDRVAGLTNDFVFIDENGVPVNLSLTKEQINVTPVLHYEVLNQGNTKIGYMVFEQFIRAAYPEFEEAFSYFNAQDIDELIVDLRYNGGGFVPVADTLAGWLIGKEHGNQLFSTLEYNEKFSRYNQSTKVPAMANGISVNRIFFIGTYYTASASELVINGVNPYVEVILAGDTTRGKPVGMNGFEIGDYMAWPVTFSYYNANHIGGFYNGLPVNLPAEDDITKDFGDPEEASLKAILDYIGNGGVQLKVESAQSHQRARLILPKDPISPYSKAF
jgi:carboxyl-terminal processing protease